MTCRQAFDLVFYDRQHFGLGQSPVRRRGLHPGVFHGERFQRILLLTGFIMAECRQQRDPEIAHPAAAHLVAHRVLQDALEQHRKFFCRPVAVFLRKLEHGVLHRVQRGVIVAQGELCLPERAPLHAGEKIGKFDTGSQDLPCLPVACTSPP